MASNPIAIKPNVEPLHAFSPSCLDFNNPLSLEASVLTTTTATLEDLIQHIADIIASHRISGPGDRYKDMMEPKLLDTLRTFVAKQESINMVVPAYPFKSPNRESKVLGPDPDVGERMSLQHLNSIGVRIQQIYPPGGHVTIVSDGPCYNDLLGVSDEEVFDYAKGLHRITARLGLKHLKFSNLFELISSESSPTTAEEYASRIGKLRERLVASFLPPEFDFYEHIKTDENALLTYRGYIKFLESDLATLFREKGMAKSAAKKHSSKVARGMIERGKAFSAVVASELPLHVRLSIHASDNTGKLSVALLPHKRYSTFPVTPWHNTPYLNVCSDSLNLGRKPTDSDVIYKVCTDDLGLKFLCADVPMYRVIDTKETAAVDQQVKLQPLYPFGLKVQVPESMPITLYSLNNVVDLAKLHSLIVVRGLHPMQYASELPDDFDYMASDGLSMTVVHKRNVSSTSPSKSTSYSVHISNLQNASRASEGPEIRHEQEQKGVAECSAKSIQEVERVG